MTNASAASASCRANSLLGSDDGVLALLHRGKLLPRFRRGGGRRIAVHRRDHGDRLANLQREREHAQAQQVLAKVLAALLLAWMLER